MSPLLAAVLSFVAASGLVFALTRSRQRSAMQVRLERITGQFTFKPPPAARAESGLRPDVLPTVTRWLSEREWEPRLRLAMLQADLRLRPAEWVALCIAITLSCFLLGLIVLHGLPMALLLGALGAAMPQGVLSSRRQARRRRFDLQLPDALMLLTSALRAGYSFSLAIETVAEELPPPLSVEFAWASGEVKLGVPLDVALGRVLARTQSPDLDLVVTAILIQLPLGGNLAEVLDAIAETIRERVRITGEVQTLTAEGRLSAGILIVLAPALALMLSLHSPDYFGPLLQSPFGHLLIGGAAAGQIVGALVIRRMVTLEV
jgi:tight adherence protein B